MYILPLRALVRAARPQIISSCARARDIFIYSYLARRISPTHFARVCALRAHTCLFCWLFYIYLSHICDDMYAVYLTLCCVVYCIMVLHDFAVRPLLAYLRRARVFGIGLTTCVTYICALRRRWRDAATFLRVMNNDDECGNNNNKCVCSHFRDIFILLSFSLSKFVAFLCVSFDDSLMMMQGSSQQLVTCGIVCAFVGQD